MLESIRDQSFQRLGVGFWKVNFPSFDFFVVFF